MSECHDSSNVERGQQQQQQQQQQNNDFVLSTL
jgi:hypothetical protein